MSDETVYYAVCRYLQNTAVEVRGSLELPLTIAEVSSILQYHMRSFFTGACIHTREPLQQCVGMLIRLVNQLVDQHVDLVS